MGTITVNRNELAKTLAFAQLGLSRYHVTPILGGTLVTITPGGLELAAFDYETSAQATVAGEADGAGRVLVDGKELAAVVKSLPKGVKTTAEITAEDDGLIVVCGEVEAVLSSLPLEEYPALPELPAEAGLVNAAAFVRSVVRVAACAGTDDTLPALTCVKVTSEAGRLVLAGTDRYRLAVDKLTWTGPDDIAALVSAKTLVAFAKKADKDGKVSLHLDSERIGLSDGTRTLITRLNPGEFPKYKSLIPEPANAMTTVLADTAALAEAVTRAGKLLERNMPVTLVIGDDGITVQAWKDGQVVSSQLVDAAYEGEAMTLRFCPAYLASMLSGIDHYGAWLSVMSPSKPILVTADGDEFAGVCMPVRVNA